MAALPLTPCGDHAEKTESEISTQREQLSTYEVGMIINPALQGKQARARETEQLVQAHVACPKGTLDLKHPPCHQGLLSSVTAAHGLLSARDEHDP